MTTCFIFIKQIAEEQLLCGVWDAQGAPIAPLALRSFSEVQALQRHARTIVVLPTAWCTLHTLTLPKLTDQKARTAIPYALEEALAEELSDIHVAFRRESNGTYLVAAMNKARLLGVMTTLQNHQISFEAITFDWFALQAEEICATPEGLLIHESTFKGALGGALALGYQAEEKTSCVRLREGIAFSKAVFEDKDTASWIATRLLQTAGMNVCQGALQQRRVIQTSMRWYAAAGCMAVLVLLSTLIAQLFYLKALSTQNARLDKDIAVLYRQFFPEASQVVNPRFRVEQWLKSGANPGLNASLWPLLLAFSKGFDEKKMTIEQLRFQNQVLVIALRCGTFLELEALEQRLQAAHILVTQAKAETVQHAVQATLELKQ